MILTLYLPNSFILRPHLKNWFLGYADEATLVSRISACMLNMHTDSIYVSLYALHVRSCIIILLTLICTACIHGTGLSLDIDEPVEIHSNEQGEK